MIEDDFKRQSQGGKGTFIMLLSCDLSFGNIGYTIWKEKKIVNCGLISSEKCKDKKLRVSDFQADQCAVMACDLEAIIKFHDIGAIIGEMPSGSQSARAAKANGMVLALISTVAALLHLPAEWCTPDAVKKTVCGKKNASKTEIMDRVNDLFGDDKTVSLIKIQKGKRSGAISERVNYHFLGRQWPKTKFEHIADSVGAYMALSNGNLVRIFG